MKARMKCVVPLAMAGMFLAWCLVFSFTHVSPETSLSADHISQNFSTFLRDRPRALVDCGTERSRGAASCFFVVDRPMRVLASSELVRPSDPRARVCKSYGGVARVATETRMWGALGAHSDLPEAYVSCLVAGAGGWSGFSQWPVANAGPPRAVSSMWRFFLTADRSQWHLHMECPDVSFRSAVLAGGDPDECTSRGGVVLSDEALSHYRCISARPPASCMHAVMGAGMAFRVMSSIGGEPDFDQ